MEPSNLSSSSRRTPVRSKIGRGCPPAPGTVDTQISLYTGLPLSLQSEIVPASGLILVLNPPFSPKFFLTRGGFKTPFRIRTPDFGQKFGVLPLKTAQIPIFFAPAAHFKSKSPLITAKYLIFGAPTARFSPKSSFKSSKDHIFRACGAL